VDEVGFGVWWEIVMVDSFLVSWGSLLSIRSMTAGFKLVYYLIDQTALQFDPI
jgi:hypothetical protein